MYDYLIDGKASYGDFEGVDVNNTWIRNDSERTVVSMYYDSESSDSIRICSTTDPNIGLLNVNEYSLGRDNKIIIKKIEKVMQPQAIKGARNIRIRNCDLSVDHI